jgi:hypothetical protein
MQAAPRAAETRAQRNHTRSGRKVSASASLFAFPESVDQLLPRLQPSAVRGEDREDARAAADHAAER